MSFFNKVSQSAGRLFNKIGQDNNIFRKITNTAKKIDGGVNKVGNFISPIAKMYGLDGMLRTGMAATHQIANGLEKYAMPLHEARNNRFR